jgi:hypothetical protein
MREHSGNPTINITPPRVLEPLSGKEEEVD